MASLATNAYLPARIALDEQIAALERAIETKHPADRDALAMRAAVDTLRSVERTRLED